MSDRKQEMSHETGRMKNGKDEMSHETGQTAHEKGRISYGAGQDGNTSGQRGKKRKNKWRLRRRMGLIVLGVVLVLLAGTAAAGYGVFHHYYGLLDYQHPQDADVENHLPADGAEDAAAEETAAEDEPADSSLPAATADEVGRIEEDLRQNLEKMEADSQLYATDSFNVLVIGVDSRSDSFSGRSDAMILVSINKKTKQVTMTSLLRDIFVSIPGHGNNRLNAAYAYGGSNLLKETIRANFGIAADRCVTVNFYLVMDLVDAVGGIDLELSADEIRVMNDYIDSHNRLLGNAEGTDRISEGSAGTVHVNGSQALAYARVRYVGTDFARTGRQRTVISKCLDKVKTMKLSEITGLAEEFLPRVRTDLTEGDCASLLLMLLSASDYEIQSMTIPADGTWNSANIYGMSVLTIDFSENVRAWHDKVEGGRE